MIPCQYVPHGVGIDTNRGSEFGVRSSEFGIRSSGFGVRGLGFERDFRLTESRGSEFGVRGLGFECDSNS